jgi:hypothetical protein
MKFNIDNKKCQDKIFQEAKSRYGCEHNCKEVKNKTFAAVKKLISNEGRRVKASELTPAKIGKLFNMELKENEPEEKCFRCIYGQQKLSTKAKYPVCHTQEIKVEKPKTTKKTPKKAPKEKHKEKPKEKPKEIPISKTKVIGKKEVKVVADKKSGKKQVKVKKSKNIDYDTETDSSYDPEDDLSIQDGDFDLE